MSVLVYIHGRIIPAEEAFISVFDRGFLFGDSVYETLACLSRRPIFLREHLDRLEQSANRIALQLPARAEIEQAISSTILASERLDCRLRIIVSRGVGALDIDPATAANPELILINQPLNAPTNALLAQGVSVEIVGFSRGNKGGVDPAVKSGNYLTSVLAIGEARRRRPGVHEALLSDADGIIAEGATSNVFMVEGERLLTPALSVGILAGVTRGKVLECARTLGISAEESNSISVARLMGADEVFLTSAVRGILPVTLVDGKQVGAGIPGTITKRLLSSYQRLIAEGV